MFSSDTCEACDEALSQAEKLAGDDVHVQEVSWQDEPDLHRRYSIETVPLIAIAGPDGAVGAGFVGPPAPTELQAALSRPPQPGDLSDAARAEPHPTCNLAATAASYGDRRGLDVVAGDDGGQLGGG